MPCALLKLVNTLLDFSRIEAGRIQASYEPTDIATLTCEIASSFRSLVERAGLTFTLDCPPLAEPVFVDREMWEKILLNLVSNAFKFTFEGEVCVRVEADSRVARLVVRDSGTGIDAKHLPHIFERFYRVEGARGRTYEGTGIGLALVHELATLHGGDVSVESEVGKGTTFTVTVPLGSAHLPPEGIRATRTLASTAVGATTFVEEAAGWIDETWQEPADAAFAETARDDGTRSMRLLVADDNADMRAYLARLLRPLGAVELVSDGQEALEAVRRRVPDVVVSDVMMPGLDGFGLVRALREDPRTTTLPIVLLSARAGEESRVEGASLGADDYVVKPFSARELVARVGAQLQLARQRREHAAALRESDERFRRIARTGRIGLFEWNSSRNTSFWSPEHYDILGFEPGAPVSWERWLEGVHPADRQRVTDNAAGLLERARAAGQVRGHEDEYRFVRPDGSVAWIASDVSVDMVDGEAVVRGAIRDISERKEAEGELRESEARLGLTLRASGVGTFEVDVTTGVGRWNAVEYELLGLEPGDAPPNPETFFRYVHPHDEVELRARWEEATRTGRFDAEFRVVRADGQERWLAGKGQFAFAETGDPGGTGRRPLRFLGVNFDITDRKRAEEALQESQRVHRSIGESIDYGVWICAPDGRNLYASESFLKLVGITQEQCSNFGWGNVLHPDDAERTIAAWKECVSTEGRWDIEHRFRGVDGNWHPILARGVPVRNEKGEITCWAGINLDIGALKDAEQALRVSEQETRSLNDRLVESDRRKDEFIAVLSHELRNPLAPIRYALPLLSEERLGEGGTRAVAVIDRQVAHLTRLVDDLLDVSRITAGKIELRPERVTLSAVLSAAVEAASPAIAVAQHSLEVSIPDAPIWLSVDAARVSQAVTNLLNNSAKYTPKGGRIRLVATADEGHAVIRVLDNGVGIAADNLPAVFEMFHQGSGGRRSQGGLGVGLALTKRLVELQGGTVEAHSAGEKKGAEFMIRLPLAVTARPAVQRQAPAPSGTRTCLRVLVVDDNVDFVDILALVLETDGHQVRKAFDGPSAVSAALEFQPHVILLDVGMPGMSGMEVASQLRRHGELAGARIVALTGWGQAEDRRRTAEAGFDEHLTKPADPRQIQRILDKVAQSLKE